MKVSMKILLEKFNDCDMFSLTGNINNVIINDSDKNKALEEIKNKIKINC